MTTSKVIQTQWLFAIIAFIFGSIILFLTPPLWGPDEVSHFFKAYQIGSMQLPSQKQIVDGVEFNSGYVPASFNRVAELFKNDTLNPDPTTTREVDNYQAYIILGSVNIKNDKKELNPRGNILYPPITYAAPAIGIFIANLFNPTALSLIYIARAATLLSYILLVFFAISLVKRYSIRWLIFTIALLPTSLYQSSTVSADPLLIGGSLIFLACIYRAFCEEKISKRLMAILLCSVAILSYIKPPYALLTLLLLFLPLKKEKSRIFQKMIRFGLPSLCLIIACLASACATNMTPVNLHSSMGFSEQLSSIISNPFGYAYLLINSVTVLDWVPKIIGILGTSFIYVPAPVVDIFLVLLFLAAFLKIEDNTINIDEEKLDHKKINGCWFMLIGLLTSCAIITVFYLTWTPVGNNLVEGVQGRYFLPIIGFLLVGLRMIVNARLVVTEKNARMFITATVVLSLLCAILWYYRVLY